jgi:hypothetical protein
MGLMEMHWTLRGQIVGGKYTQNLGRFSTPASSDHINVITLLDVGITSETPCGLERRKSGKEQEQSKERFN